MSVKLIITDLDRTLLRTDKSISNYTADVLKNCSEQDIKIVFATARPKNRVDILPCMDIADAIITDNGACIYMNDSLVDLFGIPAAIVRALIPQLLMVLPDERISIEYPDVKIANFDKSDLWLAKIINDIAHPIDSHATKIVVNAGSEVYDRVMPLLCDDIYAQLCEGQLTLIMHRTATKMNAIYALAKRLKVKAVDIVAFGDDLNDIVMLENCGMGVAVSNGIAEAKAAADYICAANDNDGVAKWIETHVLGKVNPQI